MWRLAEPKFSPIAASLMIAATMLMTYLNMKASSDGYVVVAGFPYTFITFHDVIVDGKRMVSYNWGAMFGDFLIAVSLVVTIGLGVQKILGKSSGSTRSDKEMEADDIFFVNGHTNMDHHSDFEDT